jgi:hypothetical protein
MNGPWTKPLPRQWRSFHASFLNLNTKHFDIGPTCRRMRAFSIY